MDSLGWSNIWEHMKREMEKWKPKENAKQIIEDFSPNIRVITLTVHMSNIPIKGLRSVEWYMIWAIYI